MVSKTALTLIPMQTIDNEKPAGDRLRIGECLVVLSSREVHPPDARKVQRLTPKSVGVLLALARRAGQVVTRDELFAEVWPDTMPTNDVLTQAITQLRKAFASAAVDGDGVAYIETISKTGYRLLVPVAWEDAAADAAVVDAEASDDAPEPVVVEPVAAVQDEAAARPAPARLPQRRVVRRYVLSGVGVLLLASTLVMAWLLWKQPEPPAPQETVSGTRVLGSPERPYRLITSTSAFETHPDLSPDGALVVFAKESDGLSSLWVQSTGTATPVQLVTPPEGGSDRFPAWSPDGREIAFARFLADGGCEVLVMPATGGTARRVTRCDGTEMLSFDWAPDGRSLIFGSMTGSQASRGIRTLELASGRWTSFSYAMSGDDFDYAPRYSPDGKRIGFVRNPQVGDLWVMDADGSNAERLTEEAAEIRGWAWLTSSEMVFGRRVDSESRLFGLDLGTRLLRDLGIGDAQSPSVSRQGSNLAFMRDQPQYGLFRFPLGVAGGEPQRLFASSGRDGQPMVSPDGRQLAFTSDRSGAFALWWARLEAPDSLEMIDGFRPEARQPMDWSADARHLLVTGRDAEGLPGIYEVIPEEGQWSKLPVPVNEPLQAVYGRQPGTVLVVERAANDRMVLALFDRTQTPWKRLAALEGVSQVRVDKTGGQVLFTRLGSPGLWQVDSSLALSSARPVNREVPTRWRYRTWAVADNGTVQYLNIGPRCATRLDAINPGANGLSQCLDAVRYSSGNGLSLAPDGSAAFVALAVADGADIGVMPVPRRPPRRLMGVAKWLPWLGKHPS